MRQVQEKMKDNLNRDIKTASLLLLKTEKGYLHDVWESYGEEHNYDFTSDPFKALTFTNKNDAAPKYLWDDSKGQSVETVCDACDLLGGRLVRVEIKTTIDWREREANLCV